MEFTGGRKVCQRGTPALESRGEIPAKILENRPQNAPHFTEKPL